MIRTIRGTVTGRGDDWLLIETDSGIGYQVFVPQQALDCPDGETVRLHTYQVVRENLLALYGFNGSSELEVFHKLLTVSGVGPKSALAIMNLGSSERLRNAIASGDSSYLAHASGIGRKTAEKVVVELKDKIGGVATGPDARGAVSSEVVEALVSLGYPRLKVQAVLDTIDPSLRTEEQIREALRRMA
ncbi:MAG TPA: Holliday junction branch migration protein RuvA [bacterium]|nr:Holliday junction branch migration protein RuvA [bacterium]